MRYLTKEQFEWYDECHACQYVPIDSLIHTFHPRRIRTAVRRFVPGALAHTVITHLEKTMLPRKCIGVHNGQCCKNNATHGLRCATHHKKWISTVSDSDIGQSYDSFKMDSDE